VYINLSYPEPKRVFLQAGWKTPEKHLAGTYKITSKYSLWYRL